MTKDRPYFQESTSALESRVGVAAGNLAELKVIRDELKCRDKRPARKLLEKVEGMLPKATPQVASVVAHSTADDKSSPAVSSVRAAVVFDDIQLAIIDAGVADRVIVNAPPGTGKTAVACGKIAALLNTGIAAHRIWLLSFTRTAVQELRNRIGNLATAHSNVWSVKVSTLDSRAWSLVQGFNGLSIAERTGGFDGTVGEALDLLRSDHDAIFDFLDEIQHIIVDEAQDLVGVRADFVMELIARIPKDAGVTVLTDDAQAIYGFAEDVDVDVDVERGTLPERIRDRRTLEFRETALEIVYRTSSPTLTHLYLDGRRSLLESIEKDDGTSGRVVRESVAKWNDGVANSVKTASLQDGALHLFRTRSEVLDASCWLTTRNAMHRVRMSGLPPALHPWIAFMFSTFEKKQLTKLEFLQRWDEYVQRALGSLSPDPDKCWTDMLRFAERSGNVCLQSLRAALGRSHPPIEFLTSEYGLSGPIVGTIHASKGREAEHVELVVPKGRKDEDVNEEARVLFVGATRARATLRVGKADDSYTSSLSNGRAVGRATETSRIRVEVGRVGDVDDLSPVSTAVFDSPSGALAGQARLERATREISTLRGWRSGAASQWAYTLRDGDQEDGLTLGRLNPEFNQSLFDAKKRFTNSARRALPQYIGPLCLLSARSVVMDPESAALEHVHTPWRESGIWLAPVVIGFPTIPFFFRKK